MAECKECGKALNQEASSIGSWCIDCIKSMSDTNTSSMEAEKDSLKKEKFLIMIFAAIGAVGGIFAGVFEGASMVSGALEMVGVIIGLIWALGGLGTGLGCTIVAARNVFKNMRARGEGFEAILKSIFLGGLFFLVLGIFSGAIFFLFLVLRRNSWIKKLDALIASENAAIAELEGYTLGKDTNTADLSRKVSIIASNEDVLDKDGLDFVKALKQLQIVQ